MHPILKNFFAIVLGIAIAMMVNMGIVMLSGFLIPLPEGADNRTMEALNATIHLFKPIHFISPFLAHALGTLAGAFVTAKLAASHQLYLALFVGLFFLAAGIYMVMSLPDAPMWFSLTDVILAYIPMAYLGAKLAKPTI